MKIRDANARSGHVPAVSSSCSGCLNGNIKIEIYIYIYIVICTLARNSTRLVNQSFTQEIRTWLNESRLEQNSLKKRSLKFFHMSNVSVSLPHF